MKNRGKLLWAALFLGCLGLASFLYFRTDSDHVHEVRLTASKFFRALDFDDFSAKIQNWGDDQRTWALRSETRGSELNQSLLTAIRFIRDIPELTASALAGGNENNEKKLHFLPAKQEGFSVLTPLLAQDGTTTPRLFISMPHGFNDALDIHGWPVRWRIPENLLAGYSVPKPARREIKKEAETFIAPAIKLPSNVGVASGNYRAIVESFANRYNLSVPLVMAIIQSESNFSPTLVSSKSAMGLMQLLPSTANDEVHRFLYGHRGQVSYQELRVPEINIRYGVTYLHILRSKYFQNVRDLDVLEACIIAAYNLGPNRFLRLYGSSNESAVEKINSMSNEEFHADLYNRLPARETRYFVAKVRRIKQHYSGQ